MKTQIEYQCRICLKNETIVSVVEHFNSKNQSDKSLDFAVQQKIPVAKGSSYSFLVIYEQLNECILRNIDDLSNRLQLKYFLRAIKTNVETKYDRDVSVQKSHPYH